MEKAAPTLQQLTSPLPTHADNGRLIVTEEVAKDNASIRLLNLDGIQCQKSLASRLNPCWDFN